MWGGDPGKADALSLLAESLIAGGVVVLVSDGADFWTHH
jgi:hypothetical protein